MTTKVKKTEAKKTAKRYDEATRLQLLDKYQELRNAGQNADISAHEVGVPYITLRTWQKNIEVQANDGKRTVTAPARGAKATKPRKQSQSTGKAPVVLVLPDGTRVECATPLDAVKFLKANR